MKRVFTSRTNPCSRRAFTLVELLCALSVGLGLAGTVMLLLVQAATEQRSGYADTTVEEQAYMLEANITSCLRSMSANMGVTMPCIGNPLGCQSIYVFFPTNGGYTTETISYNSSNGQVVYTPNASLPSTQIIWMSNTLTMALTSLYFSPSFNPDGSENNSLVNVTFQMNDNGFSQQGTINNPTSIYRNFSVQMRNDN